VVVGLSVKLTMVTMIQTPFPLQWSSPTKEQIKLIQKSKDKIILGHSKVLKIQYLLEMEDIMEDMVKLEQEMEDMVKLEQEMEDMVNLEQEMEDMVKLEQEMEDIIKLEEVTEDKTKLKQEIEDIVKVVISKSVAMDLSARLIMEIMMISSSQMISGVEE